MTGYRPNPDFTISSEAALRAMFAPTHDVAIKKVMTQIDTHAREFITRSPFLCIGSQNLDGMADVSPRGDPAGFVKILDAQTIAIPDRPGNNRLDTLSNIVANPSVGVIFMIPGFDETMRVNGTAQLTTDPALLADLAVHDRTPNLAIVVSIIELYIHCAKAYRRARLWDVETQQDRSTFPSLMKVVNDQIGNPPASPATQAEQDSALEAAYKDTMY